METRAEAETLALRRQHAKTWRDKSTWHWMRGLLEEVAELALALVGLHEGPVEWELQQIAAICINWLDMRYNNRDDATQEGVVICGGYAKP